MRVIFLDVGGVLNSNDFMANRMDEDPWGRHPDGGFIGIDREAVGRLNTLIRKSGAQVVLSSTWRLGRGGWQKTLNYMRRRGYLGPDFLGATPDLFCRPRGHEIQQWLDTNPGAEINLMPRDEKEFFCSHPDPKEGSYCSFSSNGVLDEVDQSCPVHGDGVDSFVILDDTDDMVELKHRLVLTSFDYGLTELDVEAALGLLLGKG